MNDTVQSVLSAAAVRLAAAGVPDASRDARRLMAAALDVQMAHLTPMARDPVPEPAAAVFAAHVAARLARQPVAQILGQRAFWGRTFEVSGDVLDPRPETETLIACALEGPAPRRVLDLGVGSGAILVTLLAEWPGALGLGTDVSDAALVMAARNALRHGVDARAVFERADWFEGVRGGHDLIVSNPPYIPEAEVETLDPEVRLWEPWLALTPGPSGLESYGRIAAGLGAALTPGGRALFEIGAAQGRAVAGLFEAAGFTATIRRDMDGRDRVVVVTAP